MFYKPLTRATSACEKQKIKDLLLLVVVVGLLLLLLSSMIVVACQCLASPLSHGLFVCARAHVHYLFYSHSLSQRNLESLMQNKKWFRNLVVGFKENS